MFYLSVFASVRGAEITICFALSFFMPTSPSQRAAGAVALKKTERSERCAGEAYLQRQEGSTGSHGGVCGAQVPTSAGQLLGNETTEADEELQPRTSVCFGLLFLQHSDPSPAKH